MDSRSEKPLMVKAAQAVAETIVSPTLPVVLSDIEVAYEIALYIKNKVKGCHPHLLSVVLSLLHVV